MKAVQAAEPAPGFSAHHKCLKWAPCPAPSGRHSALLGPRSEMAKRGVWPGEPETVSRPLGDQAKQLENPNGPCVPVRNWVRAGETGGQRGYSGRTLQKMAVGSSTANISRQCQQAPRGAGGTPVPQQSQYGHPGIAKKTRARAEEQPPLRRRCVTQKTPQNLNHFLEKNRKRRRGRVQSH